ncbi:aromatic amino acid transport family protein [Candidatus Finniella inopinata]|nr:aromatic amino acid transport family protein [Candidatus Finniella inopinata]
MSTLSRSRVTGALLIVAGTTIGAAMLALPMTSIQIGFFNTVWLLTGMWVLMAFTALVTLEINLRMAGKGPVQGTSVAGLAYNAFGRGGQVVAKASLLLLFYALLAAYITGSSSLVKDGFRAVGLHCPFSLAAIIYTLCLGWAINSCVRMVDYANRFFFTIKMIVFVGMIVFLMPYVRLENLTYHHGSLSALSIAAPIFFTSFGFHGSIPTLINYVGPHPRQLRFVIILGSLFPLIVYLLWQMATLGILPPSQAAAIAQTDVAGFVHHLNAVTNNPLLGGMMTLFTFLAITTSFLGVAIGLFDALAEGLSLPTTTQLERLKISLLTFLPPLFFALFYHDGFIIALGYAAIALSILAVLIPTAVALKWRRSQPAFSYQVSGGNIALIMALIVGLLIIMFKVL